MRLGLNKTIKGVKRMRLVAKTATYGVLHICVATAVAYVLTGNLIAALGIGLIEPMVQTVVFTLHEWAWERDRKPQLKLAHNHRAAFQK